MKPEQLDDIPSYDNLTAFIITYFDEFHNFIDTDYVTLLQVLELEGVKGFLELKNKSAYEAIDEFCYDYDYAEWASEYLYNLNH